MSGPIIFYAWQSDRPKETTRSLIQAAAADAIGQLTRDMPVEESPRLDHDVLYEPGLPVVTETIFRKIKNSALIVADVTFCSEIKNEKGAVLKSNPNPNVMLEVGYALGTIGWERVILVMNTHYGSAAKLPFDLRHRRWPTTFEIGPNSSKRDEVLAKLTKDLIEVFRAQLAAEYDMVDTALSRMSSYALFLMKTYGANELFWEIENENKVVSRFDLAITLMLEANVIQLVHGFAQSESGSAYRWTYLGRQCCRRLGVTLPAIQAQFAFVAKPELPVDTTAIDRFDMPPEPPQSC